MNEKMENLSRETGGKSKENKKDTSDKPLENKAEIYDYSEDYKAFDSNEELKKIKQFSQKGKETTPERLELKKSLIKEYNQKLADQKMGIAEINAGLEKMLPNSREIERDKLEKFLAEKAKEHKLSKQQIDNYRKVFDEAEKRNKVIKKFTEEYKNRPEDFFEATFGRKPVGEVIVESSAISIVFICKDIRDYAWAHKRVEHKNDDLELDKNDIKYAESTGGCAIRSGTKIKELDTSVILVNASERSEYKDTVIHEEEHIVRYLIENIFSKKFLSDLKSYEKRAKGEILAFLKEGQDMESIKNYLFEKEDKGGLYDYFAGNRKVKQSYQNGYDELINQPEYSNDSSLIYLSKHYKAVVESFERKEKTYYEHLENALDCIDKLEETGFSRDKIIGLFQMEKLAKWPKVYKRIKRAKEFQDKLRTKIKEIKKEVDDYKRKAKDKILANLKKTFEIGSIRYYLRNNDDQNNSDDDFYNYPSKSEQQKQYLQKIYSEYINQTKYANDPDIIAQAEECKKAIEYIESVDKDIENALRCLAKLETYGFYQDEVIKLLQREELPNWPKAYERIEKSDIFQDNLKEEIKRFEGSIKKHQLQLKQMEEEEQSAFEKLKPKEFDKFKKSRKKYKEQITHLVKYELKELRTLRKKLREIKRS